MASQFKRDFMQHRQTERFTRYSQKVLHGYFVRSHDKNLDEVASVYWLTKGELPVETEGLFLAAQDQELCTRAMQHVFSDQFFWSTVPVM